MALKGPVPSFDRLTVALDPGITVVEASAGTGKTYAVTRLVLRFLLERKVEKLSQILVVTFTRKAAQELVTRVRSALREAATVWSSTPPPRSHDNNDVFELRDRHGAEGGVIIRDALASLDDLAVSTIHAFCDRVLRESALESRVHFAATFLEDDTEPLQRSAHDWARKALVRDEAKATLVASAKQDPVSWVTSLVRAHRRHADTTVNAGPSEEAQLLHAYVQEVSKNFKREKARRHLMAYDDLLRRLYDVLQEEGENGPLAQRIRQRYCAAIIDEFQDTDPIQFPIFSTAFAGLPLFLIGDPKQSIYSFRGADIDVYLKAGSDANAHFTMDKNFRSSEEMISAVDALFRLHVNPFQDARIDVPRMTAGKVIPPLPALQADGRGALHWMWVGPENTRTGRSVKSVSKEMGERLVVRAMTNEIVRLLREGVRGSNIAVLVRTNWEARAFKDALNSANVPAVVGSEADVLSSDEADELLRLVDAVANPRDSYAVRAAMSTRLWGNDAAEIQRLTEGAHEPAWSAAIDVLTTAHELWSRKGIGAALTHLLVSRGAMVRLLSSADGERRLTNLRHLIELFDEAAVEEPLPPSAFRAWVIRERDVPNTPERRELRLESDASAVQILTIHKAKGLQWDVVFCPTLWRVREETSKTTPLGVPVYLATDPEVGHVLDLDSPQRDMRKQVAQREEQREALRVAYVALTRAVHRCYVAWGAILGAERSALGWWLQEGAGEVSSPVALQLVPTQQNTLLAATHMSWSAITDAGAIEKMASQRRASVEHFTPRTLRLTPQQFDTWIRSSYSGITAGVHAADVRDVDDPPLLFAERATTGAATGFLGFPGGPTAGSAVHKLFEDLNYSDAAALTNEQVASTLDNWGIKAPADGRWTVDDVRQMLVTVCSATIPGTTIQLCQVPRRATAREWRFDMAIKDFSIRAVADVLAQYGSKHAKGYAPILRMLQRDAFPGYLNGSIDVAFEHDQRWYILDWKSNWLGSKTEDYRGAALDHAMQSAHYTLQYHLYMLALHRHLKVRHPHYDPARHWGGVAYVFLRGVHDADHTAGWFRDMPTPQLLQALDAALGVRS